MTTETPRDIDAAVQRVRELSEQVIAQARTNGLEWLEGYERMLRHMLDLEKQAAASTGAEWVKTLASAHADFVRDTSEVFLDAMRSQLKGH
jgi:hypothetical protein